jgi:threonine/homoserine/homoserine lactone efflux protein
MTAIVLIKMILCLELVCMVYVTLFFFLGYNTRAYMKTALRAKLIDCICNGIMVMVALFMLLIIVLCAMWCGWRS